MKKKSNPFLDSVPVLFGYIPLGFAFGILFSQLGHSWFFAPVSSILILAGAAQFLSIELIKNSTPLPEIFFTIFILNLRHVFYGLSLVKRFQFKTAKPYLIFGLTDETYSVITAHKILDPKEDQRYCFTLTLLNHCYWVLGTTIGAWLGATFHFDTRGFEFVLTALFTVLCVEQGFASQKKFPFAAGIVSSVFAQFLFPKNFLWVSISLTAVTLGVLSKWKGENE